MIILVRLRVLIFAFILGGLTVLYFTTGPAAVHHVRTDSGPLALRSGPGPDYPAVASLVAGTEATLRCWAASTMWVRVTVGSDTGWAPGSALDGFDPSEAGLSFC